MAAQLAPLLLKALSLGVAAAVLALHGARGTGNAVFAPPAADLPPPPPRPLVAVCVGGQPSRLQPDFLRDALAGNSGFRFAVFYNLARPGGRGFWNARGPPGAGEAKLANMSEAAIEASLRDAFAAAGTVEHLSVAFHAPVPPRERMAALGVAALDRVRQYVYMQERILDMYSHQVACAAQVAAWEAGTGVRADLAASTREDVAFLAPLDLGAAVRAGKGCDVASKECSAWGGIAMRFQLLSRRGLEALGKRFEYYRLLWAESRTVSNPENFEEAQAADMGLRVCPLPVGMLPAVGARPLAGGGWCVLGKEYKDSPAHGRGRWCVPEGRHDEVEARTCAPAPPPRTRIQPDAGTGVKGVEAAPVADGQRNTSRAGKQKQGAPSRGGRKATP
ncbi:hypothetical protein DFJ74DRAFT_674046 [Hyaloraphidium curvatum]|nr:hypothetical protein DFJ74DRAFT_674046 [Hyaloraphidium curvatum]